MDEEIRIALRECYGEAMDDEQMEEVERGLDRKIKEWDRELDSAQYMTPGQALVWEQQYQVKVMGGILEVLEHAVGTSKLRAIQDDPRIKSSPIGSQIEAEIARREAEIAVDKAMDAINAHQETEAGRKVA